MHFLCIILEFKKHVYVEVPLKDMICRNPALKCHNIHITQSNSTFHVVVRCYFQEMRVGERCNNKEEH